MIKQITALLLLLAFARQTFSKAVIMMDYLTNTKAYVQNCENKARPQMHCNGKCQMVKKLKEEEKKDQKNPERKAENKNELVLSSKSFYPELYIVASEPISYFTCKAMGTIVKIPRLLLRPPIC